MAFQFTNVIWGSFYFIFFSFTLSLNLSGKKAQIHVWKNVVFFLSLKKVYAEFAVQLCAAMLL